jgi:hypothetical protein
MHDNRTIPIFFTADEFNAVFMEAFNVREGAYQIP